MTYQATHKIRLVRESLIQISLIFIRFFMRILIILAIFKWEKLFTPEYLA